MTSKIKAAIRVRPFLPSEVKNGYKNSRLQVSHAKKEIYVLEDNTKRSFHFDYLFSQENTQNDVYTTCKIEHMIDKAIEGYHSTIFAYGQTGSGKTHTMQGAQLVEENKRLDFDGLIPRAISDLYKKIKTFPQRTFTISVSFLQIYNEKIYDLLNPASFNAKTLSNNITGLRLRWNKDEQFNVQNLFVFQCKDSNELLKYFMLGLKNRVISSHKLNVQSSRSHSILTIKIESFQHSNPNHILSSRIELVDLAGSERIGLTGTEGKLAKESIDINKSLFTLRQVISILAEAGKSKGKQRGYIPYRDSKLTSILKQSIGGNSHCLMIACINPNDNFLEENLSTLTYATKASYITNQPIINDDPRSKIIADLKRQVKNLTEELNQANEHIQLLNVMKSNPSSHQCNTQYSQKKFREQEESSMPEPIFKKKVSQQGSNEQFSERLVESINMVRQLLKSNKQLREQLQASNKKIEEKDIDIYELARQNDELKEMQSQNLNVVEEEKRKYSRSQIKRKTQTKTFANTFTNGNIYGFNGTNGKNHFNFWNSSEINQYYLNEKGIDTMPTKFNKRQVNSSQANRVLMGSRDISKDTEQKFERGVETAQVGKRSWMSKNSEGKKFLSFYNEP